MKKSILALLLLVSLGAHAQKLKRKIFDYYKMSTRGVPCNETLKPDLDASLIAIEENNSRKAVEIAKATYEKTPDCPAVYDVYGLSLFRSGEWMEGIAILEKGIEKFGSVPELIKHKAQLSLEMAELGISQRNVDGNSMFLPKSKALPYKEEQFKEANLRSALADLDYLSNAEGVDVESLYSIGKINQMLGEYKASNSAFSAILSDEQYGPSARYNIAENHIITKRYPEAESDLLKLSAQFPHESAIYEKLSELYALSNNQEKQLLNNQKSVFYSLVPNESELEFNDENYTLINFFFSEGKSTDEKLAKLHTVHSQKTPEYTVDLCLAVLKMHANHGNGVEEECADILGSIGQPAISKTNALFTSQISTCTMTHLAQVMATVKDESSWEILLQYLPQIANIPMTLTPPELPEMVIRFKPEEGLREVLKVTKDLLQDDKSQSDDPWQQLSGFSQFVYYAPLQNLPWEKVETAAKELGYSEDLLLKLKEKAKKE